MNNSKVVENLYSPVRVGTVVTHQGRMLFNASDVLSAFGVHEGALIAGSVTEVEDESGQKVRVVDMRAVTTIASLSPLPYARDLLDWLIKLSKQPISESLVGMEKLVMSLIEAGGDRGINRNVLTRKTQKINSIERNKLIARLVSSGAITVDFQDGKMVFRVGKRS